MSDELTARLVALEALMTVAMADLERRPHAHEERWRVSGRAMATVKTLRETRNSPPDELVSIAESVHRLIDRTMAQLRRRHERGSTME